MVMMSANTSCKGTIYKADVQHCVTKKGVLFSVRLNKMKRLSCKGCEHCGWLDDELSEIDPEVWPIIDIQDVEHGKLYVINVTNIAKDWETGFADSWDLKVNEYVPEKPQLKHKPLQK